MAITRFRNSTIGNRTPKYNDVLAGLPFRPIIGTATDGGNGTSVSVAFTGNNPAGAGITYTALSSPGSITATGPASPITVTGLTAGTAYTFQVKAGNSLGDSAYSASSNSVTPVTPTAFESIATATGTGSTLTFTSIPNTYQHLQIRGIVRSNRSGFVQDALRMTFNSSTTGYALHRLWGNGATASASGFVNEPEITLFRATAATASTNTFGTFIIDIHDYASTTKNKTIRYFGGFDNNDTNGEININSGLWANTNAISSISIGVISGTAFVSPSSIALYGIKGA